MFVSFPTSQDGTLKAVSSYVVQQTKSRFLINVVKKKGKQGLTLFSDTKYEAEG